MDQRVRVATSTTVTRPPSAPVSPFAKPASLFQPRSLFAAGSPFQASPFASSPFAQAASPFRARSPFGVPIAQRFKRQGLRDRNIVRKEIILPKLSGRIRPSGRLYLPYEEICRLMDWTPGAFTYQPGMDEDFTELARAVWGSGEGMECEELRAEFCLWPEDEDRHSHPLSAWSSNQCPVLSSIEYDSRVDNNDRGYTNRDEGKEARGLWVEFLDLMWQGRQELLADPELLLGNPAVASSVAVSTLKVAGYELGDGLHNASKLVEVVRYHLGTDDSVRAAFADVGFSCYGASIEHLEDVDDVVDAMHHKDLWLLDIDELTFLTFDPDDFDEEDMVKGGDGARLMGDWIAVEAEYHSLLDTPSPLPGWSWAIGWREVLMKPYGARYKAGKRDPIPTDI